MMESMRPLLPSHWHWSPHWFNGRAIKRLLYVICLWTVCILLFRFMTYYGDRPPTHGPGPGSQNALMKDPLTAAKSHTAGTPAAGQAYLSSLLAQLSNSPLALRQPPPHPTHSYSSLVNTHPSPQDADLQQHGVQYAAEVGQLRSLLQKLSLDYAISSTQLRPLLNLPPGSQMSTPNEATNNVKSSSSSSTPANSDTNRSDESDRGEGGDTLNAQSNSFPYKISHITLNSGIVGGDMSESQESDRDKYVKSLIHAEPHVDHSTHAVKSDTDLLLKLANETNLPIIVWNKIKKLQGVLKQNGGGNVNNGQPTPTNPNGCNIEFPSLFELQYNNVYWQQFRTRLAPNETNYFLYNAYYDDRWRGGPLATVRLLAMIDRVAPPPVLCQLWFDRLPTPIVVPASYQYAWYPKWGNYRDGVLQPFIVNCRVPRIRPVVGGASHESGKEPALLVPSSVSIVERRCDKATNNLKVVNNRPPQGETKKNFAVCVKGLDFLTSDLSVRLVEWLELLKRLGADKVFLYELEIHPNISKVLHHYVESGLVELTKISLPGNQPNLEGFRHLYLKNKLTHKRQNELIPYNDCLYRNLYTYKYLVLLDTDEVIMPMAHDNWTDLMEEVQNLALVDRNYTRASYNVRNVYFLDDLHDGQHNANLDKDNSNQINTVETHLTDQEAAHQGIPKYLHMLNHVYRSRNYTKPGQYVKCFHNTERVVSLHNHFPLNCFGSCTTYSINVTLAQLQHYRKDCVGPLQKACNTEYRAYTTKDTTIWRYKDEIIDRTAQVLTKLGFFN